MKKLITILLIMFTIQGMAQDTFEENFWKADSAFNTMPSHEFLMRYDSLSSVVYEMDAIVPVAGEGYESYQEASITITDILMKDYIKWVDSCNDSIKRLRIVSKYNSIEEAEHQILQWRAYEPPYESAHLAIFKVEYGGAMGTVYELCVMSAEVKEPTFEGFYKWLKSK